MKQQHRVLGMLALLSIIHLRRSRCIAVAGPRMQEDLHISPQACPGWVTSGSPCLTARSRSPSGVLGDRIGSRREAVYVDHEDPNQRSASRVDDRWIEPAASMPVCRKRWRSLARAIGHGAFRQVADIC